jgi:hypothetical protein
MDEIVPDWLMATVVNCREGKAATPARWYTTVNARD